MTDFIIQTGDITECNYDAIVNSAHKSLLSGSGVCGVIHKVAGRELEKECLEKHGECEIGKAVITSAYSLPCKHVIHTVTPRYFDLSVKHKIAKTVKERQLFDCYQSCLHIAMRHNIKSIAFPCLGDGKHGFSKEHAASIAIMSIKYFIFDSSTFDIVSIFCSNRATRNIYKNIMATENYTTSNIVPITIGQIRYVYKLDMETAEDILNNIGGVFNSQSNPNFIKKILTKDYSQNKIADFIKNLYDNNNGKEANLYHLLKSNPIIQEARFLSKDERYIPLNIANSHYPLDIIYSSIIDTCVVCRDNAVLYLYEDHNKTSVKNDIPGLITDKIINDIAKLSSLRRDIPAAIWRDYINTIEGHGKKKANGSSLSDREKRDLKIELYKAADWPNEKIANEIGCSISTVSRAPERAMQLIVELGLPSIKEYYPDPRTKRLKDHSK